MGTAIFTPLSGYSVQYRFIPSKKLEDGIKDTIINKENPLVNNVEEALVKRVVNAYKDFF